MPRKQAYKYKVRKFLNDDLELPAMIVAVVPELGVNRQGEKITSVSPTLTISDCSRQINLDFSFYDRLEKEKIRKKINLFRNIINSFSDALLEVLAEAEELDKEKKNVKSTKK